MKSKVFINDNNSIQKDTFKLNRLNVTQQPKNHLGHPNILMPF